MYFSADVYWNKGAVRTVNQDSLVVLQALTIRGRVLMAAVCDGMGGMDMGECASGYLTEELVTWFYDGLLSAIGKKKPLWVIRRSAERKLYQVQSRLQRYADRRSLAMGTTLSLLVLWEKKYMLWHLGDSRIYQFFGGTKKKIRLLTLDHVQGRNKLTKCVGSFGFFMPDYKMGHVKPGEAFLLCSDGFWHNIREEEMLEALAPEQMRGERIRKRLCEIGEADMRRGERDNLSAIYVSIRKRKEEERE
ncbi:MAG: serine/threonine-protein phosphatase [Lachnospiraceae bacterium]|nr:serine/threonine-protein phosphatase [Lachnospiraceae bacterium]